MTNGKALTPMGLTASVNAQVGEEQRHWFPMGSQNSVLQLSGTENHPMVSRCKVNKNPEKRTAITNLTAVFLDRIGV